MRENLLRPSLTDTPPSVALYPSYWSLLPGVFLGPLPVILYSAVNSYKLRRAGDVLVYAVAFAGMLVLMYLTMLRPSPQAFVWLQEITGFRNLFQGTLRMYAVALWAAFYWMHRQQHRSGGMMLDVPSGWIPCIASAVVGGALTFGLLFPVTYLATLAERV